MGKLTDQVVKFYQSQPFLSWYSHDYRLKQLKKMLEKNKPTPAERLNIIKYLDAHLGEVPEKGPDSGNVQVTMTVNLVDDDD